MEEKFKNEQKLKDVINNTSFDEDKAAVYMTTGCHRYLQQKFFEIAIGFIQLSAENYKKGFFDARNEYACKKCSEIMDALENEGLHIKRDYSYITEKSISEQFESIRILEENVLGNGSETNFQSFCVAMRENISPEIYARYLVKQNKCADTYVIATRISKVYEKSVSLSQALEWVMEYEK